MRRLAILIAVLLIASVARAALESPPAVTTAEPLARFPASLSQWRGTDSPLDEEVVDMAAVDDYLNRYYNSDAGELALYVGYYQSQAQGEALHSPLFCLPGAGWQPVAVRRRDLRGADGSTSTVNELVVERGLDRLLVLYWYQTRARITASEYARKLFQMRDAVVSGRTDVALVRVVAPIMARDEPSEARSASLARGFAELVLPQVQQRLFRQ
jgi:EpsI family protein